MSATAQDALNCCKQTQSNLGDLSTAIASFQDEVNALQATLKELENRIAALEEILRPVIDFTTGQGPLEDWLRLDLLKSDATAKDVALSFADGIAKSDKAVATKVIDALDDELMDWILSKLMDALDFMPAGIPMANTTGARDPSGGQIIIESDSGEVRDQVKADLDKQTDAGAGIWEFTFTVASLVDAVTFSVLTKAINKKIPDKAETDPAWDLDKSKNFATADPKATFTDQELADIIAASKATPIRRQIIATTNAQGAPVVTNIPDGWTAIKVNPIDPNNPFVTNFGPIIDQPAGPIEKTVDANGNVTYSNVFPGLDALVAFTDENGIVHSTNLVPGSTPFDSVTDQFGNTVLTNFDQNSVPFTTGADDQGNLIIEPR